MNDTLFRERSPRRWLIPLIAGLVVLLGWFFRASWTPLLLDRLTPLLQPVSRWSNGLKLPHWGVEVSEAEMLRLKAENDLLLRKVQALQLVADENQELRSLLKLTLPKGYRQIGAEVVMRAPHQWFESLTIDQGFDAGLDVNQVVMDTNGVLGKITEVTAKTAKIQLISHPESRVACVVGKQRIPGVLIGQYRDEPAQLQYLQNYARLSPGDEVFTSGLGGVFPPNLALGRVQEVIQEASKPVPEAKVLLTPLETAIHHVIVLVPEG